MWKFEARLLDLKRATNPHDGKPAFESRIRFMIQNLIELRQNGWKKKQFKDEAQKKDKIRKAAALDAKTKGNEVKFQKTVVGVRPTYIDDLKNTKPSKSSAEPSKPVFNEAYVRKAFQYYLDERNGDNLQEDWQKPKPTAKDSRQGVGWLLDIGFNDVHKETACAETIVELLNRNIISWQITADALQPYMDNFEDMRIDVPGADVFFHSLIAKLLTAFGRRFESCILKGLPSNCDLSWSLLVGALRKVKDKDLVRKSVEHELSSTLCKVGRCSPGELRKALQEERVL